MIVPANVTVYAGSRVLHMLGSERDSMVATARRLLAERPDATHAECETYGAGFLSCARTRVDP